ncbi:MAG: homoserine dehydrogenase [Candidatus Bipolaricaulota bacterium]|nr:homoserine dehydrogenase [Candidatus Bipolaricaulota bacterium]
MEEHTVDIVLVGVGNLGRRFIRLIDDKAAYLKEHYDLEFRLIGVADSRGVAYAPAGLDPELIIHVKEEGRSVGEYPAAGQMGTTAIALVDKAEADVLCEASPVNLKEGGEPGLSCIRAAISRGMHVVTPNKGPIVLAYQELVDAALANGVELRFDGTVAGGLPALYLGARDLRGATIHRIEAVPNEVTGYILDLLAAGNQWGEALSCAQESGHLEADPSWDIDGWDAAAKLVILTNAVLGFAARLEDVDREGIKEISVEKIRGESEQGRKIRLFAVAERKKDGSYTLQVRPKSVPVGHPLGHLGPHELGVVYYTDIYGRITAIIDEPTPTPSAATMLRDILDIYID